MASSHSLFSSRSLKCTKVLFVHCNDLLPAHMYQYLLNCGPANIREDVDAPGRDGF